MNPKPTRVALYQWVSKDDSSQESDNQFFQLREIYEDLGHDPETFPATFERAMETCPHSSVHTT